MIQIKHLFIVRLVLFFIIIFILSGCSMINTYQNYFSASTSCTEFECADFLDHIFLKPGDSFNYVFGYQSGEDVSASITSGALPPGLELKLVGGKTRIAGTAKNLNEKQDFEFTVEIRKNNVNTCDYTFNFTIDPDVRGFSNIMPQIINQDMNVTCSQDQLINFNPTAYGPHEFRWYIVSGTLPDGITFDSETGEISGIAGIPFEIELGVEDVVTGAKSPRTQSVSVWRGEKKIKNKITIKRNDGSCFTSNDCHNSQICVSTKICLQGALNKACDCFGSIKGTCKNYIATGAGVKACSLSGSRCGNVPGTNTIYSLCCQGLSCNNGVCEGPNGRCPYSIN